MGKVSELQSAYYRGLHAEYMEYVEAVGYKANSRHYMGFAVKEFMMWCEAESIGVVSSMERADIENYHRYMQCRANRLGGGLSEQTIQQWLHCVGLLFTYLEQTYQIQKNPMSTIALRYTRYIPRESLSRASIECLYESCRNAFEHAMLGLLYGCGLRSIEASRLLLEDVHLRQRLLYVSPSKRSSGRVVPMSMGVQKAVQWYMQSERVELSKRTEGRYNHILLGQGGKPIDSKYLSWLVTVLARRSGDIALEGRRIGSHLLRHSIATHLLESGMSLDDVRMFLGHKRAETTQLYTHVSESSKRKEFMVLWS